MQSRNYRDLIAWQKSMDFCESVYTITGSFPRNEIYGLTQQMRRAAVSLPSNIAEGQGRKGSTEFNRFLVIAVGSLCEIETQIMIACRLGYMSIEDRDRLLSMAAEIGRLLNGLRRSLER